MKDGDNMERALFIIGPNSDHISKEDIEFLGKLMARFLYHEIDKAAEMLHQLTNIDLENLEKAGYSLYSLSPIVKGD